MQDARRTFQPRAIAAAIVALALAVGLAMSSTALSAKAKKYGYVSSALMLPVTNTEARDYGRDFNRDGARDNQLGQVFANLASQGLDMPGALDAAVADGDLLMLHSLKTPTFSKTKDASWQVLYADPAPAPDFSGSGSFTIDDSAPISSRLPAKIKNNKVSTGAGGIPVQLDLGSGLFALDLVAAKVFATCDKSSCSAGRINGGLRTNEIDLQLIPAFAELFSALVARDCPGPSPSSCVADSQGKTVQNLFDENDDLVVSADEVRENSLIQSLLAPDLDLEKANGQPGQDGENDALSFGIGFTAVKGTF
ncbi:MAG: hypothetical protein QOI31_797 [Solirubrobacterales bacterium]|jgi:hypothetical protein|nr:hypothetical protein [Solirubrobacterales bacterium]